MASAIRDYQSFIYLVLGAVGVTILFVSINDLIIHNASISSAITFQPLGNWLYWVFAIGLVFALVFFYMFFKIIDDTKKFERLINSSSKQSFVTNLKDLEKLSKTLGRKYSLELKQTKQKWKVK